VLSTLTARGRETGLIDLRLVQLSTGERETVQDGGEMCAVVLSGAETDVCVLATVLSAVDFGFRVVIVEDALCSSLDVGHDALMTLYRNRFSEQIDLVTLDELNSLWQCEEHTSVA